MRARTIGVLLLVAWFCAGIAGSVEAVPLTATAEASKNPELSEPNANDDLLMHRERYFYSSFARRDPFASLVKGGFAATGAGDLLDIGEISLVGVMWGDDDKFAVVQDQRGHVHVLRTGDRVVNGKVTRITRSSLTVQHYFFGETANVTIQLQGEGENETR